MPLGKTFDEYRVAVIEDDPTLAEDLRRASVELELGIALQHLRWERGLSQRALADLSGMKQPTLARIERGSQPPGIGTLTRILGALNGVLSVMPDGRIIARPAETEDAARTEGWDDGERQVVIGLGRGVGD
jgi:transcriptional regulator with XRE-family HTH domain